MKIQKFKVKHQQTGEEFIIDFENIASRYARIDDLCLSDRFQVLLDGPTHAVWRINKMIGVSNSYDSSWYDIDLVAKTIRHGFDQGANYKTREINNWTVTATYTILAMDFPPNNI